MYATYKLHRLVPVSTIILVHGAWQGAWCWNKLAPLLRTAGHQVHTPDLPGHGNNPLPAKLVNTAVYVKAISELVESQHDQVILVGHSMGGMVITQVAEQLPDRVARLVYISGFLLENGQSINDLEPQVTHSSLAGKLLLSGDKSSLIIPESIIQEAFYSDCTEEDYRFALTRFQAQPVQPFLTPAQHSEARFGSVPRVYIECLFDRAIPVQAQRFMHQSLHCAKIVTLECAHSPFYSVYNKLADVLLDVSTR